MSTLVSDVITYARYLAQTDANGLTDTIGLSFANDGQQNIIRELLNKNIDAAQTQEAYTSMTTNGSYAWPVNMYALKTIEIDYTGTGGQNYIQGERVDVANIQGNTSFDYLRLNQSTQRPLYDNRGDTFEIFPTPTAPIANGIKIFYFLTPTEYIALNSTISYPLTLDYRCLSARVASLYAMSTQKYDLAKSLDDEFQKRLQQIITILAPGSQQPVKPLPLQITGWEF